MAAAYDGGVVLGADSRTSTGNYVANRATDKLTQLTDKVTAYVARSAQRFANHVLRLQPLISYLRGSCA